MPITFPIPRADEYLDTMRERVKDKTFRHARGAAEMMLRVVGDAGIEVERGVTAALLHDYCKAMKAKDLLAEAEAFGIDIQPVCREHPLLLHGPVGAEMGKRDLGVEDPDVLEAIYWHTTGKPGWNPVGLALYFCDFSEAGRTMPESAKARELLETEGYAAALRYAAEAKVGYIEKEFTLDPMTAAFAKWLKEEWGMS